MTDTGRLVGVMFLLLCVVLVAQGLKVLPMGESHASKLLRVMQAVDSQRDEPIDLVATAKEIAQPVPPQPTVAIPPPNVLTLDWLEEGEVVPAAEFAPVTEQTLGPKAGDTIYVPEVGEVVCGAHAEERHGEEAIQARHHFASGGGNWQDCKDGRKRGYKPIAKGYTAMMVVEGNAEVSAFISNRTLSAIERVLQRDGCLPPVDPFSGAAVAQ